MDEPVVLVGGSPRERDLVVAEPLVFEARLGRRDYAGVPLFVTSGPETSIAFAAKLPHEVA